MGGRAHRTCRWVSFAPGHVRYHTIETARVRAALARQSALEPIEGAEGSGRYLWVDQVHAATLGTVRVHPDAIEVSAETTEDLEKLAEFLEACLRGLIHRVPPDAVGRAAPTSAPVGEASSAPAGTDFVRRMLDRWTDVPWAALSERTPREVCGTQASRAEVARALLGLERDMARQKRLGRAWGEVEPLWDRLNLARPLPPHAPTGEEGAGGTPVREKRSAGKR